LDKLLASYYDPDQLVTKIGELEALAKLHQALATQLPARSRELENVEQQIAAIFNPPSTGAAAETPPVKPVLLDPESAVEITIDDLVTLLNYLKDLSSKYLGRSLTTNYLQASRPDFNWLTQFQLNPLGQVTYSGAPQGPITALQLYWFQQWSEAYIQECTQVMQILPTLLDRQQLAILYTVQVSPSSIASLGKS
jgi:hypothetical protein